MRKKKMYLIILGLAIAIAILSSLIIYINKSNTNMANLPTGDYLTESTSPDGSYTVRAYLCNGGATVDYAIRGELLVNPKKNKPKNIYWDYKTDKADITWKDNNTVIINDHKIDLPDGEYDFRNN